MRNVILLVSIVMVISIAGHGQDFQPDTEYYRVQAFKFKYGKADEATQRGIDLFRKARTMIGLTNMVFRSESGPYDLLVFDPVKKDHPFEDDHRGNHYKAMVEIMGTEAALGKELESWSDLVVSQETFYYKQMH